MALRMSRLGRAWDEQPPRGTPIDPYRVDDARQRRYQRHPSTPNEATGDGVCGCRCLCAASAASPPLSPTICLCCTPLSRNGGCCEDPTRLVVHGAIVRRVASHRRARISLGQTTRKTGKAASGHHPRRPGYAARAH